VYIELANGDINELAIVTFFVALEISKENS
jgi:hypothetical protein